MKAKADDKHRVQLLWFFKGQTVKPLGVRSHEMNRIVATVWRNIKQWDISRKWALCEALWQTGILEDGHLACKTAYKLSPDSTQADFARFERWLGTYVHNWAHCDDLCTKALGTLLHQFPDLLPQTDAWLTSDNRWKRRGAAVSLLPSLKTGNYLERSFKVADALSPDNEDLVLKGYGWMLKVASQLFPDEVFNYVMDRRSTMPRVALRYAIEKLPRSKRKQAMVKP